MRVARKGVYFLAQIPRKEAHFVPMNRHWYDPHITEVTPPPPVFCISKSFMH